VRALVSAGQRAEIESVVERVEKIETATEPRFQELFVEAMGFPDSSTPTPHLSEETVLPVPRPKPTVRRSRRRTAGAPGPQPTGRARS
jgi:uncharacterized 2Fe-2S/4Fe-4S cluster protein (DUF4445 family)